MQKMLMLLREKGETAEERSAAAAALWNLACSSEGQKVILQGGGVKLLLKLLTAAEVFRASGAKGSEAWHRAFQDC